MNGKDSLWRKERSVWKKGKGQGLARPREKSGEEQLRTNEDRQRKGTTILCGKGNGDWY